jgi:hypothetical protein
VSSHTSVRRIILFFFCNGLLFCIQQNIFVIMVDIFHSITNEWAKFDTKDLFSFIFSHASPTSTTLTNDHSTATAGAITATFCCHCRFCRRCFHCRRPPPPLPPRPTPPLLLPLLLPPTLPPPLPPLPIWIMLLVHLTIEGVL